MKTKTFDCVAMQHRGGQYVRQQTKNMTREEKIEFWRRGTEELLQLQQQKKAEQLAARSTAGSPGGG